MKYIRFVPAQTMRHPVTWQEIGKAEQDEILLTLTTTPEFLGELRGVEATELLTAARKSIRRQKSAAPTVGYYELEDAHGKALKLAAEKFQPNTLTAEAVHPHLEAIVEQKSEPPKSEEAATNGAQAQAS
jgi:hypothetical protein